MRRVMFAGLTVLALSTVLTGCGAASGEGIFSSDESATPAPTPSTAAEGQNNLTSDPYTFYVTLPNKNQVFCVGVNGGYGSGESSPSNFSCDWANAQRLNKNYVG